MKTIRLSPAMNMLDIDRYCAQAKVKPIKIILGREKSRRNDNPERDHVLIVTDIK